MTTFYKPVILTKFHQDPINTSKALFNRLFTLRDVALQWHLGSQTALN